MSWVTNTILTFSPLETGADSDPTQVLAAVNKFFEERESPVVFIPLPDEAVGGDKVLERPTFIAAINYLNLADFSGHLASLPWNCPEDVQLIVCEQEDDEYRVVFPCRKESAK